MVSLTSPGWSFYAPLDIFSSSLVHLRPCRGLFTLCDLALSLLKTLTSTRRNNATAVAMDTLNGALCLYWYSSTVLRVFWWGKMLCTDVFLGRVGSCLSAVMHTPEGGAIFSGTDSFNSHSEEKIHLQTTVNISDTLSFLQCVWFCRHPECVSLS